jgi:hypothetical protein
MTDMADAERRSYPWLAESDAMSFHAAGDMTESGNGAEPHAPSAHATADGADAPGVADSTPSMHDSGKEPAAPFLQSLVDAMRQIADQTRDEALGKLRAAVAERSAGIRSEIERRAAELHEAADADLARVAEWENAEVQRIREEAGTKVSARNATLDAQLAANVAAGEGAMTAVEARVDAFEAEMTSFFAQLNEIHDPAALAAALKNIPQAPSLSEPAAASSGDTAPSPAASPAPVAAEAAVTPAVAPEPAPAPEPPAESVPAVAAEAAEAHAEPAAPAPVAVAAAPEPMIGAPVSDKPAAEPPVEETGEEATTQVLVTGLTSFGAITSFKQSLERVAGVHRVALGLGTSGEFIFTAVHRAGFDLANAIRSFEEAAQFVASDGQLRVTVAAKA